MSSERDDADPTARGMGALRASLDEAASSAKPPSRPGAEPRVLPRRFYTDAAIAADGPPFAVLLDGRAVRTPAKAHLALPTVALASAVAEEWAAQGERIDPATMPLTRIANTALDGVAQHAAAVRSEIAAFAGSDLLCYRADAPAELAALQEATWGPVLAWANDRLGVQFAVTTGLMPIEQPGPAVSAVDAALAPLGPLPLAAMHVATSLTGSAILALALLDGHLDAGACWRTAHLDEDWQIERWGPDAEAAARRERGWRDMQAAARVIALAA